MRRPAFTLVELLAATALAALLLAAGFRVIGSLGRARAALARQEQSRAYVAETLDLLRWDLANARYMKSAAGELTLTGYGSLDPQTFAPRHRPVTVRYRLVAAGQGPAADGRAGPIGDGGGGQTWLVREQIDLDASTNHNRSSSLVCAGVAGFGVWPAADPGPAGAGPIGHANGSTAGRNPAGEGPRRGAPLPDDERVRRRVGLPRRSPQRPRPGATAQDLTGWEGPTLGLGKPEDHEDVPAVVRVVLQPAVAGGPAVDELVYAR